MYILCGELDVFRYHFDSIRTPREYLSDFSADYVALVIIPDIRSSLFEIDKHSV